MDTKFIQKQENQIKAFKAFLPKITRAKRNRILHNHIYFRKLYKCTSKYNFRNILISLPEKYKLLIKKYIRDFFLIHIHLRPIGDVSQLMLRRNAFYEAVSEPESLIGNKSFANNLIKNFCRGMVNFFMIFYDQMIGLKMIPRSENIKHFKSKHSDDGKTLTNNEELFNLPD